MVRIRRDDETASSTGSEILDTLKSLLQTTIYR